MPESQIEKNNFEKESSKSIQYLHKNVGQIFMLFKEDDGFHHFGIDKNVLGRQKQRCNYDPLERCILNGPRS